MQGFPDHTWAAGDTVDQGDLNRYEQAFAAIPNMLVLHESDTVPSGLPETLIFVIPDSDPPTTRAVGALVTTNGTSLTPAIPSAAQVGDVLLMFVAVSTGGGTLTPPAGWTAITGGVATMGTTGATPMAGLLCWKACIAGDPGANATWTNSASGKMAGFVASFYNVDTTSPIDVLASTTYTTGGGKVFPAPTATTLTAGAVPLLTVFDRASGVVGTADVTASSTWTYPSGYTQFGGGVSGTAQNAGDVSIFAALASPVSPAGAIGGGNITAQYLNTRDGAVLIALKPSA